MDREISKDVIQKERRKQIIKFSSIALGASLGIYMLTALMRPSINMSDLRLSAIDKGAIEVSVSASGRVLPAFEEIINSPISSRILEVYAKGGDSVDVGTPILKLDLQSFETEYKQLLDEEQMKEYKLEQLRINTETKLADLSMKKEITAMNINRMSVELRNEQYLDSLGAGTTDKVRQAALSYEVALLEQKQLDQQIVNERQITAAELKVQALELSIFRKSLAETKRILDDAQIRSPRKAVLTFINDQIGAQVSKGAQLATLSDLSHFKVEGEIADSYSDRIAVGRGAILKIGTEKLKGTVSSVTPLSKNGVISFSVQLDNDNHPRLRSGLKADVHILHAIKEEVLRIANGSFYVGKGEYELFVLTSDNELLKRKVQLGESNFEYVEVLEGLEIGDRVVISDMTQHREKNKLKIKTT